MYESNDSVLLSVGIYSRNNMSHKTSINLSDMSKVMYHAHSKKLISDDEFEEIKKTINE